MIQCLADLIKSVAANLHANKNKEKGWREGYLFCDEEQANVLVSVS